MPSARWVARISKTVISDLRAERDTLAASLASLTRRSPVR